MMVMALFSLMLWGRVLSRWWHGRCQQTVFCSASSVAEAGDDVATWRYASAPQTGSTGSVDWRIPSTFPLDALSSWALWMAAGWTAMAWWQRLLADGWMSSATQAPAAVESAITADGLWAAALLNTSIWAALGWLWWQQRGAATALTTEMVTPAPSQGQSSFQRGEEWAVTGDVIAGVQLFMLCWAPTLAMTVITSPWRIESRVHPLLQIWQQGAAWHMLAAIVASAVIIAPLLEELVFRVVWQTHLERFCSPVWTIGWSSLLFVGMHHFRDAVALVPFALILGAAYVRRRRYLEVVVAHAAFNAWYLSLALLPE
jgi:membrane protease YdiL (CAAX protease family)